METVHAALEYAQDMSRFYNPKVQKVSIIIEGKLSQLYAEGMQIFEQYNETCKYFAKGKQRENNASEVQDQLQLHDLSMGEYVTDKYALWLDFRMIDENVLHGMGRVIGSTGGGIILQIEKTAEMAGVVKVYVYLIMDAQLNAQNEAFVSAMQ